MDHTKPLSGFIDAIQTDAHIGVAHIGLYAVLLQCWEAQKCQNPVMAFSHDLMKKSKISTRGTYLKCMNDLHCGGYVRYERSFKRNEESKIFLISQQD